MTEYAPWVGSALLGIANVAQWLSGRKRRTAEVVHIDAETASLNAGTAGSWAHMAEQAWGEVTALRAEMRELRTLYEQCEAGREADRLEMGAMKRELVQFKQRVREASE